MPPTVTLSENDLWFAERNSGGFLVSFWLDAETAAKLAVAGGEAADSLHLTICYLGDAAEMGELGQIRAIAAVDKVVQWYGSIEGTISGYGRFIGSESSYGQDVFYATPDLPTLPSFRQAILESLNEFGTYASTAHGYSPHITLAYLESGAANPVDQLEPLPLKFSSVTIMAGSRRVDIPMFPGDSVTDEPISMVDAITELPPDAPLGTVPIRPLLFAMDQEWIPFLPKPGNYQYRPNQSLDFGSETYDRILRNFNDNVYKQDLPIRVEHDAIAAGAVGWIKPGCMRLASDGSIEVKPEWTPTGKGLVDEDRFRYTSAEVALKWQEPLSREWHKDVAVGLALVTRPHFKTDHLRPLAASEAVAIAMMAEAVDTAGETGKENPVMADDTKIETPPTPVPGPDPAPAPAPEPTPPADPAISLMDVVITAEQRRQERQLVATLTDRAELAERRASDAEVLLKEERHKNLVAKFTAEVMGRSAENGTAWFGSIQANVDHLVSLAEAHGEDSAEIRYTVQNKRSEAKAIKASGIFDPISVGTGEDLSNVNAQVARLTDEVITKTPSLTKEQAERLVFQEHPELYDRYLGSQR